MKTLLYANRAEPKSISVILILLLAAVGAITKLRCMHSVISLLRKIFANSIQFIKECIFLYILLLFIFIIYY